MNHYSMKHYVNIPVVNFPFSSIIMQTNFVTEVERKYKVEESSLTPACELVEEEKSEIYILCKSG